jgi:4-carboxymuconolactone decarboxylase
MTRITPLKPEDFSDEQKVLAERIAGKRGHVRGPFLCWLRRPQLCDSVEALGAYLRWNSSLPTRISELSILVCARYWDAVYSWAAHADKAVEAGVSREAVDALARGETPVFAAEDETVFYDFAMEMLKTHFVSQDTYRRAVETFGEDGVVDIVAALGNFSMLAFLLNTFQIDLRDGIAEPFPDIERYQRTAPRPKALD